MLVARALDRLGNGIRGAPRDALIADDVPAEHLGRAFGFHRSMDTLGAVIGPLLGLALFELFNHHYRPVFIVAVIPAVLSAVAVLFVHEQKRPARQASQPANTAASKARLAIFDHRVVVSTSYLFGHGANQGGRGDFTVASSKLASMPTASPRSATVIASDVLSGRGGRLWGGALVGGVAQ